MKLVTDKTGTIVALKKTLAAMESDPEIKSIIVFACDNNGFSDSDLDPVLNRLKKPVWGGIFPELISGNKKWSKGTIIAGLSKSCEVQVVEQLSDSSVDYEAVIDEKIPNCENIKTMLVLVDGFSRRIGALIDSLFNIFGLEFNYIGGGAGSLSFIQQPCLITNQGLLQDCAVIASYDMESGIGVSHGWEKISGPYKVTESDGNIIKTLNWEPAFEVYKNVVDQFSKSKISKFNFFEIAKQFPFGISRLETEKIVRDPFSVGENNSLICVGEVPEGVFVDILKGNSGTLINAAKKAYLLAEQNSHFKTDKKFVLFMDCISRVLFLEDKFEKEIDAVYNSKYPLFGALTIGEIANNRKDYLEFYNKTAVIGVIED